MNESTVRDYIKILQEDSVISINTTNKYSVITVENWEIYQSNDEEYDNKTTAEKQQDDNSSSSERQQKDTYKNGRELKEVKNVKEFITTTTSERLECDSIQFYQNNFGIIRPQISEEIVKWSEDLGEPLIVEAMKRSLDRNKPTWGYVKSILQSWINKGIRTVEQANAEEVEYKNKKANKATYSKQSQSQEVLPEWFKNREEQEKHHINKKPSIEDTARTIELAIKFLHIF